MNKIMIDIETMGTSPGCVILSIGAVEFDDTKIVGEFHVHIDIEDAVKRGGHLDPRTVLWWLEQSKEAQNAILEAKSKFLEVALLELEAAFDWEGKEVWCNGAGFDFPILKAAHDMVGRKLPWAYYNEMDYRTLKNLAGKDLFESVRVRPTLAHDGLEDARAQALTCMALRRVA